MVKRRSLLFSIFLVVFFGLRAQAWAPAPSASYEFVRAGAYDLKCKLALEIGLTPLEQLSRHLHMSSTALNEALRLFQKSAAWPTTEALFFYGSRAHKYWGNKYDLDVLVLRYSSKDSEDRVVLDTREFVAKNNFRIDVGNSEGKTLRSLLVNHQLMSSVREALFLSRVTPALARAREIADRAAKLSNDDQDGNAQIQQEIKVEKRQGNPFFQNQNLSLRDFPSVVSAGYRQAARALSLEGPFLTTKSPILIKVGADTAGLIKQLRRRGYSFVYLINEDGSLSSSLKE